MDLKLWRPMLEALVISVAAYLVHKLVFVIKADQVNFQNLYYPLETLYGFFLACSLIIIFILIIIKKRSFENVGYVFLLLTCLKMGVSYILLSPILASRNQYLAFNKVNFFIVFAVFLTIETVVTSRILNNKQ